jgi:hypothetical protein
MVISSTVDDVSRFTFVEAVSVVDPALAIHAVLVPFERQNQFAIRPQSSIPFRVIA